jgi:hypothetical protein
MRFYRESDHDDRQGVTTHEIKARGPGAEGRVYCVIRDDLVFADRIVDLLNADEERREARCCRPRPSPPIYL